VDRIARSGAPWTGQNGAGHEVAQLSPRRVLRCGTEVKDAPVPLSANLIGIACEASHGYYNLPAESRRVGNPEQMPKLPLACERISASERCAATPLWHSYVSMSERMVRRSERPNRHRCC
jgi:hypothetical protein